MSVNAVDGRLAELRGVVQRLTVPHAHRLSCYFAQLNVLPR